MVPNGQWDCASNKLWNGFKQFVSGHMTMCDGHGHLAHFLGTLGGRTIFLDRKGPRMATTKDLYGNLIIKLKFLDAKRAMLLK